MTRTLPMPLCWATTCMVAALLLGPVGCEQQKATPPPTATAKAVDAAPAKPPMSPLPKALKSERYVITDYAVTVSKGVPAPAGKAPAAPGGAKAPAPAGKAPAGKAPAGKAPAAPGGAKTPTGKAPAAPGGAKAPAAKAPAAKAPAPAKAPAGGAAR